MSMKLRYKDSDKLDVILVGLLNATGEIGLKIQRRAAKVVKAKVVGKLNSMRTDTDEEMYTHMADDVRVRTTKNEFGKTVVKVQGGSRTGPLWHIVNDGTYRSKASHFMDTSLNGAEKEIENIIDEELRKAGF